MTDDLNSRARQLLVDIGLKEPKGDPPEIVAQYDLLVDRVADHLRQVATESREEAMRDAATAIKSKALDFSHCTEKMTYDILQTIKRDAEPPK